MMIVRENILSSLTMILFVEILLLLINNLNSLVY